MILNLEIPENTELRFKINMFPDGQRSITLNEEDLSSLYKKSRVLIVKTISKFEDLELILSAASAIRTHTRNYSLYAPYIIGARSDRKFEPGGDFYFDDVVIPSLEIGMFQEIFTLDNHCYREGLIESLNFWAYSDMDENNETIIFPDQSAAKRFGESFDVHKLITMKKERSNNEITQVPETQEMADLLYLATGKMDRIIIYDDLFDGGASYVGLCKELREKWRFKGPIVIFVTHMIGSNAENLRLLDEMNVEIQTTNSYQGKSNSHAFNGQKLNVFSNEFIEKFF